MKSAIVVSLKAFANQIKANYKEHITKEYNRLNPKKSTNK